MSEKPVEVFLVPNFYLDFLFPLLDHEEQAMLIFACRRIFGPQVSRGTSRIAASQFSDSCAMHQNTVAARLKNLSEYKVFILIDGNDPKRNTGPEWALQLEYKAIDWNGLKARKTERFQQEQKRTSMARSKSSRGTK